MDVNPDQIMAAGGLSSRHLLARAFRWLNRLTIARAAAIVTLDRFMLSRLRKQSSQSAAIKIIPPWAKTKVGRVPAVDGLPFRRIYGLEGAFVIMYSGNHAIQHPLTTLLDAAALLEKEARFVFVFVGGGAGKAKVEERIAAGALNLRSLPFQPAERLRGTLGAADLHIVSMGDDAVGIVHPCKIYGAMAVGRPILFFGPQESHGGEIVRNHSIGWRVAHGDVEGAVTTIVTASGLSAIEQQAMGHQAVNAVQTNFTPVKLLAQVCDVIERTVMVDNDRRINRSLNVRPR